MGGGPAGYEAALVAAQHHSEVTVVERDGMGGACAALISILEFGRMGAADSELLIILAGLYLAFAPGKQVERALLEGERARLMRELVAIEERRRSGKAKAKDAERRPALVAELERVLATLDEAPGGGQGAAA